MKRTASGFAIAVWILVSGGGCERSVGSGDDGVAPISYESAVLGCIHWSICHGFASSIETCDAEFEMLYLFASPAEREALNRSYDCLARATSCDEVAACDPGECADLRTCDGDTLVTCVRGYETRVHCGEPLTSGPRCLLRDDGEATCGQRVCTPDDVTLDAWCEGSILVNCRHGVVETMDCQTSPGLTACDDTQTYAGCTEALGEACDPDTFVPHCDGAEIVECSGQVYRCDCSLWAHHPLCVEQDGSPLCAAPDAPPLCATTCAANVLRFCGYGVTVDVDCATFGQVCDDSTDHPTCR